MNKHGLEKEEQRKIIGVLKVLFPNAKIYLYGSRARGDFHDRSDIDLALIDVSQKEELKIGEAKTVLEGLWIAYKIDVVDLNHVNEDFRSVILREGVLWTN
jgi:uncharacterized protein